jgi:hypothetical protein
MVNGKAGFRFRGLNGRVDEPVGSVMIHQITSRASARTTSNFIHYETTPWGDGNGSRSLGHWFHHFEAVKLRVSARLGRVGQNMYRDNATELAALIAAIVPLTVWIFSGLWSVRTRAVESRAQEWRRLGELALSLYNRENTVGQWAQIAAINEISDVRGKRQRVAALAILQAARLHFGGNPALSEPLDVALARLV